MKDRTHLVGRALEPWRALLAVAAWLDDQDAGQSLRRAVRVRQADNTTSEQVLGLFGRLEALACAYQQERSGLETSDLVAHVIRGLCHCATRAACATSHDRAVKEWIFTTAQVKQAILDETNEEELNPARVTPTRVGQLLAKLRCQPTPRAGGKGSRQWQVTLDDLARMAAGYALKLPDELTRLLPESGTSGTSGTSGAGAAGTQWEEYTL